MDPCSSTHITLTTPCHCLWFVCLSSQTTKFQKTEVVTPHCTPALSMGLDTKEAPSKGSCNKRNKNSQLNAEIVTYVLYPIKHVLKRKPCGKHPLRLVKQEKPLARGHVNLFERAGNQQSTSRAHFHPGDLKFYPPQSPPSPPKTRLRRQRCKVPVALTFSLWRAGTNCPLLMETPDP